MRKISLIKHSKGAPGLSLFGLGPNFIPCNALEKLKVLFNQNAFWAKNRNKHQIRKMLRHSSVIVTIWSKTNLIGFGRATTDKVYRAVLWDIVISKKSQRLGLGKIIIEALLNEIISLFNPISNPSFLTSSLNKNFRGSTNFNFIFFGNPPTL